MLKEIRCARFSQSPITFKTGLNVVLGDDYSTNSIGKSTSLMIIDFVFGGNSFLEKDSGSIKALGHLKFEFQFQFSDQSFFYTRTTDNSGIVSVCDIDYNVISEIGINDYTKKLKEKYELKVEATFRSTINPYSRIWGKENYKVDKPILNSIKESEATSIENFIKLFNLYDDISKVSNLIKNEDEYKAVLTGMIKKEILQKTTKNDFIKNQIEIERINKEITLIQDNLLRYTLNIEELSNKDIIELKTQKQKLLEAQSSVLNKIKRLELNLGNNGVKSKYFNRLSQFFESPNIEKIKEIESFHNKISNILKRELESAIGILQNQNEEFLTQIREIDFKIDSLLENLESPKFIVEKLYDLTIQSNTLKEANKFYEQKETSSKNVKDLNINLDARINKILLDIESKINNELIKLNEKVYTGKKKIPTISLKRKNYIYDHSSNTGTGKSYADLIEFDLSILKLTDLPILIHDSVLFKNIEDKTVDKIVEQYLIFNKQIFIALDGIVRYNQTTQNALNDKAILKLSETKKLFNEDWR